MVTARSVALLLLLGLPLRSLGAQALVQPLPQVRERSSFQTLAPARDGSVGMRREDERKNGVEAFLTGAGAGALLGIFAGFFVACPYSTDRSCIGKTMGAFALGGGILFLLAEI